MAEVLKQLAEMQRSELRLRQSIKGLLTYPVLLTVIAGIGHRILVVFVLPRFADDLRPVRNGAADRDAGAARQSLRKSKSRWWLWIPLLGASFAGASRGA